MGKLYDRIREREILAAIRSITGCEAGDEKAALEMRREVWDCEKLRQMEERVTGLRAAFLRAKLSNI